VDRCAFPKHPRRQRRSARAYSAPGPRHLSGAFASGEKTAWRMPLNAIWPALVLSSSSFAPSGVEDIVVVAAVTAFRPARRNTSPGTSSPMLQGAQIRQLRSDR
jgi:hypothetical protein